MLEYIKRFSFWNTEKAFLNEQQTIPYFKEREIWWCALGVNIGSEIDGKNDKLERPVLILKKLNREITYIVPITSKDRSNINNISIIVLSKEYFAKISQVRVVSGKRLIRKIHTLEENRFVDIKSKFIALFT